MNIRSGINLTKLAIALGLLCSMFGFNAMAQTNLNKTLDAKAVTALIEELTDGLPDLIEDEEVITAITEKWEAHEDLAGKTKAQILELLFEDVKSVVTNEEFTKKIWDSWNSGGEESKTEPTPVETPKPQPIPAETPKPIIWIKVVHNGAYIARFNLTWDEPNKPNNSWKGGEKPAGFEQRIDLPDNATNIRLTIEAATGLVWDPWGEVINKVLQPNELNKCYRAHGTTLNRLWDNNCQ